MGIFASAKADVFVTYQAEIVFRDRVMGGTPKDAKVIEGWLRSKAGIEQEEEIRRAMVRTLQELGAEVGAESTYEELVEASSKLALNRQTNGFKRDANGLYLESRTVKAAIKESTNILFAGQRWLATKKGPRSVVAERVFVNPDALSLGVNEASGVELFIGHTSGPKGPQSNLTHYEYVQGARINFDVMVAQDAVENDHWEQIWCLAEENGLGSLRSQGFGRFDIERWDRVRVPSKNGRVKETAVA